MPSPVLDSIVRTFGDVVARVRGSAAAAAGPSALSAGPTVVAAAAAAATETDA